MQPYHTLLVEVNCQGSGTVSGTSPRQRKKQRERSKCEKGLKEQSHQYGTFHQGEGDMSEQFDDLRPVDSTGFV